MIIRNFEYLLALHQERHFARAAARCSVSQPTLSAGIKQLEEDMGVQIVKHGRRFDGLTPEGELVLVHAQQMWDDCQRLQHELHQFREKSIAGPFRVGVSPATIALASVMSIPFAEAAPTVRLSVETMPPDQLSKALRSGQIDIALGFLAETPEEGLSHHLLYREQMHLLSPKPSPSTSRVTLDHAKAQPLCLLRSSLPAELEAQLAAAPSILWTDSMSILQATLATGRYASIIPQSLASNLSPRLPVAAYPVKDPSALANVGFITLRTEPVPTMVHRWLELAHTPALVDAIRAILSAHKSFAKPALLAVS